MDGKALVDSVKKEVIEPGIQRLMETPYFSELRSGKLSIKRMQGWAIQHYLHNKAILKSFALGMVKNAQDQTMFDYFTYQLNEEHGLIDVSRCVNPPKVGDRVRILPNHTCVVSNLFDRMFVVNDGKLVGALPVEARGKSN